MRIEDDSINLKLVLEDSGEIARVLMAFSDFNFKRAESGLKTIPISIMNQMEDCLAN